MNSSTKKAWQEYVQFLTNAPIRPHLLEQGEAIEGMYAGSTEHERTPLEGPMMPTFKYTLHYFLRADNHASPVKILGSRMLNECLKQVPLGSHTFIGRNQDIELWGLKGEKRKRKDYTVEYWTDKRAGK